MSPISRKNTRVLSDRYELLEKIGSGGMAEVYLGRDRILGRTVAVKTLLSQFSDNPQFIARFRREAQAAAGLNHPHIVGVYDTGTDDGTHFIVMEYVEGKTLRDVLREEGPLLPERAADVGAEACTALAYAHSRGLVHRDVKPGNIMITPDGAVKVTDFGIARAMSADTVTHTATVMGTAQYFSPEQAQGGSVDARSDVYSMGIVLYEILTRQVPFTGSSPVAIAYKHVKEDPLPPTRLNPDIPSALEAITMKALAKNPANRYQSAEEMRQDLGRAAQGRPVSATPVLTDQTSAIPAYADETVVITRRRDESPRRDDPVRRRRRTGYLLLALITAAIAGVGLWALAGLFTTPERIAVPNVVGEDLEAAQERLRDLGFDTIMLPGRPSEEFEPGVVMDQDPAPGVRVERGETIRLTPSDGPQFVAVPVLRGMTRAEAEEALGEVGLGIGTVTTRADRTVPEGRILSQNPNPGARLRTGETVDLVVSSGVPTAVVPDVIGDREATARSTIAARNLVASVRYEPVSFACDQPPGRVCRQEPASGTTVEEGSTVTIVVSEDPREPPENGEEDREEPSPDPAPQESPEPET